MSKRVTACKCEECGELYYSASDADECEQRHRAEREQEERETLWRKVDNRAWALTKEQIEQVAALLDSWGVPK